MYKRDCLDHARLRIATHDADEFKITYHSFNWNKYHYNPKLHLEVHTTFLVWHQYWNLYKRKEIRSLKKLYTNFAKQCRKNEGQCVISIKPGYDNNCVLRFRVKDCYCLTSIDDKQRNGFVVKSSQPVIVFELGKCIDVMVDRDTLKRIENKAKKDALKSNLFTID